jgi:hypothetical protein
MSSYAILTNRRRSIIALIHSIVFALIALRSIAAAGVSPIWLKSSALLSSLLLLTIYVVVSSVLIQLVRMSRSAREKLYFGFCASSASLGLLRNVVGDHNLPAGQYLRLLMLLCAVLTGIFILRSHAKMSPVSESGMQTS